MMVDLSMEVCGVRFPFPTMISAGPLSRSGEAIKRAGQQYGLGAVVTKTINRQPGWDPQPYIVKSGRGLLNRAWADVGIDQWLEQELPIALEAGLPIIASVSDPDPETLADMAYRLQEAGASMIESPMHGGNVDAARAKVEAMKRALDVPLVIKVGPDIPDLSNFSHTMVRAGADILSGINTLGPCLAIDVDSGRPLLGTAGGIGHLSGPAIKPLAVAYTAELAKTVEVPIWAGGGIRNGNDALELFMVGACCIHVHTAAILEGLRIFEKIANQIESFLAERGYESVGEVIGLSLSYLEEGALSVSLVAKVDADVCNSCGLCYRSCLYAAVEMDDKAYIREVKCAGCGLCASVCPKGAIALLETKSVA